MIGRRFQHVAEILGDRRHFDPDPMTAQLDCEISKVGVARYQNYDIWPHLNGELERVDRHHHIDVRLVVTFLGWRSIFGHDHESVGAQPLDELVFLVALLLPHWRRGWQTGVDHHFDQIASGARAGQKIAQLQPIEAASGGADRASNIRLIDEHQDSGT